MQRLYFLTPNANITSDIADELSQMGLTKDDLHVVGRNWKPLEREGVPVATVRETTDVMNAPKRGVPVGAGLGAVLGVIIHLVLGPSLIIIVPAMAVFGGLFGLWTSTMVGISVKDVKVDKYKKALNRGALMMIADVPSDREETVKEMVRRHHPEVVIDQITPRDESKPVGQGH
ncbi:hypothetical protein SAMN05192555_106115 [Franzmannia pantelleriensis]|uniref:DUF1269 domain-containing protein n=1 Tax=Franzmannia pantelleriensis TaxID=48727 RepID=A0A1G9M5I6_9GAMM|nr:DUF1269 domain-containing protein [Halomonas pantelleriensis]SDL69458.1 hypothetical protein SAMN05192555_106115 [Halomonas pantelleriensis]